MWTAESTNHMRCFLGPFADPQSHVKIQMGKLHAPDMALSSVTVSQSTGVYFTLVGNNVWQSMYELSCFGGEEEARLRLKLFSFLHQSSLLS